MGWPGPVTHRQHLTYLAWLELQWNQPSRTDHYLARIACEVRRTPFAVWGKSPSINPQDFILRFVEKGQGPLTDAQQALADELSKARWKMFAAECKPESNGHGT